MRSPLVLKNFCLRKLDSICRGWSRGASVISRVGSAVGVRILRILRGCLAAIILFATLLSGTVAASAAAANRSAPAGEEATPPQIQQFLTLLADPKVQTWLKQQSEAEAAAGIGAGIVGESRFRTPSIPISARSASTLLVSPKRSPICRTSSSEALPASARTSANTEGPRSCCCWRFLSVWEQVSNGYSARRRRGVRGHLDALPLETVASRVHLVAIRFAFAVGMVVAFALGSVGPFLALDWPPLLREMLFGLLIAFLALRVAIVIGRFLLAPRHERFRIIPMGTVAARSGTGGSLCLSAGSPSAGCWSGCSALSAGRWKDASSSPTCSASASSRLRWKRCGAGPPRSTRAPKRRRP